MNDSIPNPNDPIPEETVNSENSKEQRREILKNHLLAIFFMCTMSTVFFFIISIPVSFMPESWILRPQTTTVKRKMPRLAQKLDAYRKTHGTYPKCLEYLYEKRAGDFEYDTHDGWRNPLIYETDGISWKLISNGADGKPGGVGINSDFFCTNYMFELGTMNNAASGAKPTWGQVLSAKDIWIATQIFPLSVLILYLNFWFWGHLSGMPVVEKSPSRFQLVAGIIGVVVISLLWAYFFAIALLIPTGH